MMMNKTNTNTITFSTGEVISEEYFKKMIAKLMSFLNDEQLMEVEKWMKTEKEKQSEDLK